MITDSFYVGAKGKPICQDYAKHYKSGLAVLSDGCSSGGETHLGAAMTVLCGRYTRMTADDLGLTFNDMVATCVRIEETEYSISGDGTILIKYLDGSQKIINVHFSQNAPDYPAYDLYWLRDQYLETFKGQEKLITTIVNDQAPVYSLGVPFVPVEGDLKDIKYVMAFSDGIESFALKGDNDNCLNYRAFLARMQEFKSINDGFFHRRFKKLKEQLFKEG